jgi:hypothetical protein
MVFYAVAVGLKVLPKGSRTCLAIGLE